MDKIRKTEHIKGWQGCGVTGTLIYCWWKYKMEQSLGKIVKTVSEKAICTPTRWSSHSTPKYLPKGKGKLCSYMTCTQIVAALFVKTKNPEQPKHQINSWMDKQIVVEPYSRVQLNNKKKLLIHVTSNGWVFLMGWAIYVVSFQLHSHPKRQIVFPFENWENRSSEKVSKLSGVAQLVSGRRRT